MTQPRQPKGTSTGGRFAVTQHAEPHGDMGSPPPPKRTGVLTGGGGDDGDGHEPWDDAAEAISDVGLAHVEDALEDHLATKARLERSLRAQIASDAALFHPLSHGFSYTTHEATGQLSINTVTAADGTIIWSRADADVEPEAVRRISIALERLDEHCVTSDFPRGESGIGVFDP